MWKRAGLIVRRKKGKTLLLFFMIMLLSSFGVWGMLLRSAADLAMAQTRQSLKGAFRITPDMQNRENVEVDQREGQTSIRYTGEPLNERVAEAIASARDIEGCNMVIRQDAMIQEDISLVDFNGKYRDNPEAMRLVSVEAHTEGLYAEDFQKGRLRLTDGELAVSGDEFAAVISERLAAENGLEIGDEIRLSPQEGAAGQEVSVTVKGLFQVEAKQSDLDVTAPVHLLENRIFIDVKSAKLLSGGTGTDYIDFFVEDPGQVSAITEEIRQIPGIDWKSFAITAHIEDYEKIAGPLADVSVLSDTLLTVIGAMGTAVLSLIQILFHKARGYETGILLSIGISKAEILLQHIAEMAMIALPSFLLSFGACLLACSRIGELLPRVTGLDVEVKADMTLAFPAVMMVFGWGSFVLLGSVLLSNLWLMHFKPGKILTKSN